MEHNRLVAFTGTSQNAPRVRTRKPKTPDEIQGLAYAAFTKHKTEEERQKAIEEGLPLERATVVARLVGEEVHYGVAICSTRDCFDRRKGRALAASRCDGTFKVPFAAIARAGEDAEEVLIRLTYELLEKAGSNVKRFKHKICKNCH